jgi:hypothetical protein
VPKKRRAVFINASSAAGQPLRAHPGLVHVNAIGDLFRRQLFFSFRAGPRGWFSNLPHTVKE